MYVVAVIRATVHLHAAANRVIVVRRRAATHAAAVAVMLTNRAVAQQQIPVDDDNLFLFKTLVTLCCQRFFIKIDIAIIHNKRH